jgi:hypothetical protein
MIRFLLITLYPALVISWLWPWAAAQIEAQIDRMQQKVHFTPGAEPPVPPAVILTGAALLSGHFLFTRLLRLAGWQALLGLLVGGLVGVGVVLLKNE